MDFEYYILGCRCLNVITCDFFDGGSYGTPYCVTGGNAVGGTGNRGAFMFSASDVIGYMWDGA